MTTLLADQSALDTIRTVVASVLSTDVWTGRKRGRPSKCHQQIKILRRDLTEKGDCLLASLQREREIGSPNLGQDAALREWRDSRTAVERFSEEYAASLAQLRTAVNPGTGRGTVALSPASSPAKTAASISRPLGSPRSTKDFAAANATSPVSSSACFK
jgi:hypothetical protein